MKLNVKSFIRQKIKEHEDILSETFINKLKEINRIRIDDPQGEF